MLKHSTTITVIGFLLFFLGIFTLFLNLVGVDVFFMAWLYKLNVAASFAIRLLMLVIGLVLIYVGQTNWDREEI
jgi:hypothetical protein